jgi:hypothetical protein
MMHTRIFQALLAGALLSGLAAAGSVTGPAITTLKVGVDGGNTNDFAYYGQSGGLAAYSMGTTSCNPGTAQVQWTGTDHPVIGQNFFRLKNGRFEQLGQSWLKHGFCAVNEGGCGACQSTPCSTLGIGCADTYWATLNDGAGGGPKWQVNAATGVHSDPYPAPSGPTAIRGRLQCLVSDMDPAQNAGAIYWAEGQYVSKHVCTNGNGSMANSWRRINVNSVSNITGNGATMVDQPAPYAWKAADSSVNVQDVYTNEVSGQGRYTIAYKVDGSGPWTYRYAIYNVSSDRSGYAFNLPVSDSVTISNVYFRDVDYHSGEPFSNVDWANEHTGGLLSFHSTQTFGENSNANALRWGTGYYFEFQANAAPANTTGEIVLFKPGAGGDVVTFGVAAPGGEPAVGTSFCSGDGSATFCPCLNFGNSGHGCANGSFFQGSRLTASGTPSVSGDTVVLSASHSTPSESGLFFQGDDSLNGGNGFAFGDGLRCAGTNVIRLEALFSNGSGGAQSSVPIASTGLVNPGDSKYYQYWYRDPLLSPCGTGFNLSNGLQIDWTN